MLLAARNVMKFRGKITDIGCIQHFTRKCGGNITVGNSVRLKWTITQLNSTQPEITDAGV